MHNFYYKSYPIKTHHCSNNVILIVLLNYPNHTYIIKSSVESIRLIL